METKFISKLLTTSFSCAVLLYLWSSRIHSQGAGIQKNDFDIIAEEQRFVWTQDDEANMTWEKQQAHKYEGSTTVNAANCFVHFKTSFVPICAVIRIFDLLIRYYSKLFKEYCLADLSRYKQGQIALRWRIQKEVLQGKGQFRCGSLTCDHAVDLTSWEVNFCYQERGETRNALVKLRLCPSCSKKLNYKSKRRKAEKKRQKSKEELDSRTSKLDSAEFADVCP
eukprot:m.55123 g.55123  ORF g.55123 m.55123 type:complete len:224 (-) comp15536_c0_seq1:191-862(-)